MMSATPLHPVRTLVLVLVATALLGLLGTPTPVWADEDAPQLSIHVDDGQADARGGATLRYTVTVTNLGGEQVRDLAVTQTAPSGTKLRPVDEGGTLDKGAVRWEVDVAAGKSVTLQTSVEVGKELSPDLFRLATVACAATSPKAAPTVCASDSDQLPAGAAVAEPQRPLQQAGAAEDRSRWLLPSALGAAALLVAVTIATLARRRRPAVATAESLPDPAPARRGA